MKSIDARKKHSVTLTFLLHDRVSPHELAQKIAVACGGSVLAPGDAIRVAHAKIACVVTDETLALPHFSYQWRTSLKEPRRPELTRNRCR